MKVCPECGQKVLGKTTVCGRCGADLIDLDQGAAVAQEAIDDVQLEDAELLEELPESEEYAEDLPVFGDAEETEYTESEEYVEEYVDPQEEYVEEVAEYVDEAEYQEPVEYADAEEYVEEPVEAGYPEEYSEEEYVEEQYVEEIPETEEYIEDVPAFGDEEPAEYVEEASEYADENAEEYAEDLITEEYQQEYAETEYQEATEYVEEAEYAEQPEYTEEAEYVEEPVAEEPEYVEEVVPEEEPLPDFPDVSGEPEVEETAPVAEPEPEEDDDEGINLLAPLPKSMTSSRQNQGIKPMVKPMARPQTNREPSAPPPAPRPASRPEPRQEERSESRLSESDDAAPSLLRGASGSSSASLSSSSSSSSSSGILQAREHPEWNLDNIAKKDMSSFTPVPPFMSAEEAERPSPFAPVKKTVSSGSDESGKRAVADAPKGKYVPGSSESAPQKTIEGPDKGAISAATRTCPICKTISFNTEKNCRGCGYQFPKSGSIADLKANSKNIIAMLAAIAMAASVFTDMITYKLAGQKYDVTLISRFEGYGFLLLALLALVFGFFGRNAGVVAVGIISVLAASAENYYLWYDITTVKKGGSVGQDIGFWLLCAGAGLILIAGIVGIIKEKKKQERYAEYLRMR